MKRISAIVVIAALVIALIVFLNSENVRLDPNYISSESCLVNGLTEMTPIYLGEKVNHAEILLSNQLILDSLHLDSWTEIPAPQDQSECRLIVNLGDEYDIYIYEDHACIYDGYAGFLEANSAYYTVPAEALEDVDSLIRDQASS